MVRLGQGPMSLSRRLTNYLKGVTPRLFEFGTQDKFKVSIAPSPLCWKGGDGLFYSITISPLLITTFSHNT